MSATATHSSKPTHTAGVPPAPPEAHLKAGRQGERRITLNGCNLHMVLTSTGWINRVVGGTA